MSILETYDAPDNFVKPRRNLVWLCLLIILFEFLSLKPDLSKKYNFLGMDFEIGNPDVLTYVVLVSFFYILWNYYIACRNANGFSNIYYEAMRFAQNLTLQWAAKRHKAEKPEWSGLKEKNQEGIYFPYAAYNTPRQDEEFIFKASMPRALCYWVLSFLHVIFRTPMFIKYMLPYFLAGLAGCFIIKPFVSS